MVTSRSRAAAIAVGAKQYFTGQVCPNGHLGLRQVANGTCVECIRVKKAKAQAENPAANSARYRRWYHANLDKARSISRQKSRDRWKFINNRRRQATPKWANRSTIIALYDRARELTLTTGIQHEVDHIVPLCGTSVCGLHVEVNLQIVHRVMNRQKSNKWQS